jgi:hypothetical protein
MNDVWNFGSIERNDAQIVYHLDAPIGEQKNVDSENLTPTTPVLEVYVSRDRQQQ